MPPIWRTKFRLEGRAFRRFNNGFARLKPTQDMAHKRRHILWMTAKPPFQSPDEIGHIERPLGTNTFKGQQQKLSLIRQFAWR